MTTITKFQHACVLIDNGKDRIIIDPGSFTTLPHDLPTINAIVVTEEHGDHFSVDNITHLRKHNPDAPIYTTESVANDLIELGIHATPITGERSVNVGAFTVFLNEVDHAVVYGHSPCKSLTTRIDDLIYYPSDSYRVEKTNVKVLMLPTSGPWFKVSEVIDFAKSTPSDVMIPTHNSINSDIGNNVTHSFIESVLADRTFVFLKPGEHYEI